MICVHSRGFSARLLSDGRISCTRCGGTWEGAVN